MVEILKKLYLLLAPRDRRVSILLLIQMCISSLINIFGIALIFPFMTLVLSPDLLSKQNNLSLIFLYKLFACNNVHSFLIILGMMVFIFLVIGNIMLTITVWLSTRFALFRNHTLSKKLLESYLFQPYNFFLDKNSSSLVKNIMVEVYMVVQNVLLSFIRLLDQSISTLAILLMLLIIKPLLSLFVFISFGGVYSLVYFVIKTRLSKISNEIVVARNIMFKVVSEGFGGIKDIKFLHRESNVIKKFSKESFVFARNASVAAVIAQMPRYVLEIVAFGGVILILVYFLTKNYTISTIIPLLSLYVFAGYRLMPSLQQIFAYLTLIKTNKDSLDIVYEDIKRLPKILHADTQTVTEHLSFNNEISIQNLGYFYPNTKKPVLHDLTLTIKKNTIVGFVGATGSGKTTLIDILLGLLKPSEGCLCVDEQVINSSNLASWQNNIGYVPQHVYLCDDTIANNIAFGLQNHEIDMVAVKKAANMADLQDFIENELPHGYETLVGERGVRLSGGQAQRIGIARALYRDPKILVLDEATSSLDGITEDIILQSVKNVAHKKTIIMIAHRLSTVKECDNIFFMKNGNVIDSGTFLKLSENNNDFKKMAKIK